MAMNRVRMAILPLRPVPMLSAVAVILLIAGQTRAGESVHPRHLIYLHGRIVQESQSLRPQHPEYGFYEVEAILDTLRAQGFVVTGELRPKAATVSDAADHVVEQIQRLLESGVPPDHIVVVGGSMGGGIALLASARLQNPEMRFCTLGTCLSRNVRHLVAEEGKAPSGLVLAIRETSDALTQDCPPWAQERGTDIHLIAQEVVVETGLGHGFLYRPLPEWIEPLLEWVRGEAPSEDEAGPNEGNEPGAKQEAEPRH